MKLSKFVHRFFEVVAHLAVLLLVHSHLREESLKDTTLVNVE